MTDFLVSTEEGGWWHSAKMRRWSVLNCCHWCLSIVSQLAYTLTGACCDEYCHICLRIATTYWDCCDRLRGEAFSVYIGGVNVCIPWSVSLCLKCPCDVWQTVEQCFHPSFLCMHVHAAIRSLLPEVELRQGPAAEWRSRTSNLEVDYWTETAVLSIMPIFLLGQ